MKTSVAVVAFAATALAPGLALASDTVPLSEPIVSVEADQATTLRAELSELKAKEQETSGSFAKFILRLKIRQLENQLNVKKALQ